MSFTYNLRFYALFQHVKKLSFHTYSSNKVNSIQYQISFKKKLNILDSDCQNAILYTKLLIQYTVLTLFFFHIKYVSSSFICTSFTTDRWNHELLQKACHLLLISCTRSRHTELYRGYRRSHSPFYTAV